MLKVLMKPPTLLPVLILLSCTVLTALGRISPLEWGAVTIAILSNIERLSRG